MTRRVTSPTAVSICMIPRANMPMRIVDRFATASVNGLMTIVRAIGRLISIVIAVCLLI